MVVKLLVMMVKFMVMMVKLLVMVVKLVEVTAQHACHKPPIVILRSGQQ